MAQFGQLEIGSQQGAMKQSRFWPGILALFVLPPLLAQNIDFARQVRPILSDKCYFCHGPAQQMNGLRFDRRESAIPVVRKSGSENELLRRITSQDASIRMPPWSPVLSLTTAEVKILKSWVDLGAPWPEDTPPDPALERCPGDRARRSRFYESRTAKAPAVKQS
jgi:hypothetical protein